MPEVTLANADVTHTDTVLHGGESGRLRDGGGDDALVDAQKAERKLLEHLQLHRGLIHIYHIITHHTIAHVVIRTTIITAKAAHAHIHIIATVTIATAIYIYIV